MQCHIYRSAIKDGLYVWMREKDALDTLPEPVRRQLGAAEFAMTIDLEPTRQLGQEDPVVVLDNLEKRGFHIQMPRDIESTLESIARDTVTR